MEIGDIYIRNNGRDLFCEQGVCYGERFVNREFGNYRIVFYKVRELEPNWVDIYRLGDGLEQLLATIMYLDGPFKFEDDAVFHWLVKSDIWGHMLHDLPSPIILKWGDTYDKYIEGALDLSEKELEKHFNSLQFA